MTRFSNQYGHRSHKVLDILRWKLGWVKDVDEDWQESPTPAPAVKPYDVGGASDGRAPTSPGTIRLTWIGHSTFLLQYLGRRILTDPIFGNCQPLPVESLRRVSPPGISIGELPEIDDVLISHSHYDHLDLPTIRALRSGIRYWVPENLSSWFRRRGIETVTELRWWESAALSPEIELHCVPAQHGSGRTPLDRDRSHWCGWILKSAAKTIYFAGDTGYSRSFRDIRERLGDIDLAILPIGAYKPRWLMRSVHLDPADAVQAHLDLNSRISVACHWGTFGLTDEGVEEPPRLLARELALRGPMSSIFRTLGIGETIDIA